MRIVLFSLFLLLQLQLNTSKASEELVIASKHSIHSKILNEERQVYISLPASYSNADHRSYPVIYILDADFNSLFHAFSGMVHQMSSDASPLIPQHIVVGVLNTNRVRNMSPTKSLVDYGGKTNEGLAVTGGANDFLSFLENELKPWVAKQYRTSDYAVLSGYSFSGLAVLQALLEKPQLFNAYIATDPSIWWDKGHMLNAYANLKQLPLSHRQLFVSSSHRKTSLYPERNFVIAFIELLSDMKINNLGFSSKIYDQSENHHSMPVVSFYHGLKAVYTGFMVPDDMRFQPVKHLKSHFQRVSGKLGHTFVPDEGLVRFYGFDRLYNDQFNKKSTKAAIEFFQYNTENYPHSATVWENLAQAYTEDNNTEAAVSALQNAVERSEGKQKQRLQKKLSQLKEN